MKNEEHKIEKKESTLVGGSTIERDGFAVEAMKLFLSHQGTRVLTPLNRIKIWLGMNVWKQKFYYNFNDIAKKSYEMADAMCRAKCELSTFEKLSTDNLAEILSKSKFD